MVRKADVLAAASARARPAGDGGRRGRRPPPPARRPCPCAARPPRSRATWTRACRSRPPRASARSASASLDAQRRRINADLKARRARRRSSPSPTSIAWALVRAARGASRSWAPATRWSTASPTSWCARPSTWGWRSTWSARTAAARCSCRWCATPAALGFRGFRDAYDDLVRRTRAGQVKPDELRGATISLTNPGGLGTVASVPRLMPGQGTIVATGAIGYPAGARARSTPRRCSELGVEKVMTDDQHLRPPRHPGRRERRVPGARSSACCAARTASTTRCAQSLGLAAAAPAPARRRRPAAPAPGRAPRPPVDDELLAGVAAAMSVVKAHRSHGHLAADLDPLGRQAARRPGPGARERRPDARGDGAHPGVAAAREGAGRELRRRPPPPARRPTAARSPTRSSTSPTTRSGSGCAA